MDLQPMYGLLEQGKKKDKGEKSKKDRITLPDREGVSGDGNKSGLPRSPGTAAGDEWDGDPKELDKETKAAQKKYPGHFDRTEMYRLAGAVLAEETGAKVTKSDGKFYYVDVDGHGEVKVKKGNLLGIGEKGLPPDIVLKALKAAGDERSKEQKDRSRLNVAQAKKAWFAKQPSSRSLLPKNESLGKEIEISDGGVTGHMTVYPDGSGAPAALWFKGVMLAFDFLGKLKVNRPGKIPKESRKFREIVTNTMKTAYLKALKMHTDKDWRSKNAEMYK